MKTLVQCAVIVILILGGCRPGATLPVRWTREIPLQSLADIPMRLRERVSLGDNDPKSDWLEVPVATPDGGWASKPVYTGEEYLEAVANGFSPFAVNTRDRIMAGFFVVSVVPLALLRDARPSQVSHVSDFSLAQISLKDLPAGINTFRGSEPVADVSLHDECTNAVIDTRSETRLSWECVDGEGTDLESRWGYELRLLAWGDFDWDGIEDLLCHFSWVYLSGSNRDYYTVILTRREPGGRLQMLGEGESFLSERLRAAKALPRP